LRNAGRAHNNPPPQYMELPDTEPPVRGLLDWLALSLKDTSLLSYPGFIPDLTFIKPRLRVSAKVFGTIEAFPR